MRVWSWTTFALALVLAIAAGAVAEPPRPAVPAPVDKGEKGETPDPSAQRAKLQADLIDLIKAIDKRPPAGSTTPMIPPKPMSEYPPTDPAKSIDRVREGMNQFRDNNFEAARRTFFYIEPGSLNREDRAFVQYMLACSLRRLGKIAEAETAYREVASSPDDEFLASCAVSQLGLIRSYQELETQLGLLRSRAKSK